MIEPVSVFDSSAWILYEADFYFTGRLVGGSPSDPELVEGWLKKNLGITDEEMLKKWTLKHLAETYGLDPKDATDEDIEKAIKENAIEKKANVFKRTSDGKPYLEGRHVKAMFKEATSIAFPDGQHKFGQYSSRSIKRQGQKVGGKSPRAFVAEVVWVPERPIIIADDSDGFDLTVGHIRDWTGTRSTLGYFEYVINPTITVQLSVLDDCLTEEQWTRIMSVAEKNGLGARRSQGAGQFITTRWEKL
ncbi:MAG TPA: hypothetical protein VJ044_17285 [Candidatus Hodarchaeales archaeon]|nr:hypothetical protein [Candidatus Hodarchaeales archaeon]